MNSPETKRRRQHSDLAEDRLSDLPDCVLLHILSFLTAKEAVQTCVLSTRWKHLWKRLPTLMLHSSHFRTLKGFTKFVSRFFSLRDASTALHAMDFNRQGCTEPRLLKRIVKYAVSHNVQQLRINLFSDIEHIPPCLFSCQTLTSLSLSVYPIRYHGTTLFPNSLDLPALTTLNLQFFNFCCRDDCRAEPFSSLSRLNSLIIHHCKVVDAKSLCISSTTLVNLTIRGGYRYRPPGDYCKIELYAPSLCTFAFTGIPFQKLRGSNLSSIKQVNIDAHMALNYAHKALNDAETPLVLLSWLIELADIKSLTVSESTLGVLSLVPDLLKVKLPSLCNLKSLKVKLNLHSYGLSMMILKDVKLEQSANKSWKETGKLREAIKAALHPFSPKGDQIVDFLIQNSPSAEVDIIKAY